MKRSAALDTFADELAEWAFELAQRRWQGRAGEAVDEAEAVEARAEVTGGAAGEGDLCGGLGCGNAGLRERDGREDQGEQERS
jgi:hypothetical protein